MTACELELPGVLLLEPAVFADERGYFTELWNEERYAALGVPVGFRQDNVSFSHRGVLRGLHYQHPRGQGKLLTVLHGSVFDVAVDIRLGSPTFGRWVGYTLNADEHRQLYVPPGYAHGFMVLSASALFTYKCTEPYDPAADAAILWSDPDLAIEWPVRAPRLSPKDAAAPRLREVPPHRLPRFVG